jgi:hypothetical protein
MKKERKTQDYMVKHRMEAEHNGKNWLEIKFLSKSRI